MSVLKAAVVGVKGDKEGIADWHARGYVRAGVDVAAVVGRDLDIRLKEPSEIERNLRENLERAQRGAERLKANYGINAKAYGSVQAMLDAEAAQLDFVSVCSQIGQHRAHVEAMNGKGVDIYVEKPFMYHHRLDNAGYACALINVLMVIRQRVSMNTQMVYLLAAARENGLDFGQPSRVKVLIDNSKEKKGALIDVAPHSIGQLLYAAGNEGEATDVRFEGADGRVLTARFTYKTAKGDVDAEFVFDSTGTEKRFITEVDGHSIARVVNTSSYGTMISVDGQAPVQVEDPIDACIRRFVEEKPLVTEADVIKSMALQQILIREWESLEEKRRNGSL